MGIRSTVCQMARLAPVHLYRCVFEHKRPLLVGVALETHRILRRRSPHLFGLHRAVYIVAIAALDQPFVDAMMKGHVELRFLLEMAAIAKFGLRLHKQEIRFFAVVRRMAGNATDAIFRMLGVDGVHVLRAAGVATQAARVNFFS